MKLISILLLFCLGCAPFALDKAHHDVMSAQPDSCIAASRDFFKVLIKQGYDPADMGFLIGQNKQTKACHIVLVVLINDRWYEVSSDKALVDVLNSDINHWFYFSGISHRKVHYRTGICQSVYYEFQINGQTGYVGGWKLCIVTKGKIILGEQNG